MRGTRTLAALCALSLAVAGCSSDDSSKKSSGKSETSSSSQNGSGKSLPKITEDAAFKAGGQIGHVWVTDAKAGSKLSLADKDGKEVANGTADRLGSFIFQDIPAGDGFTVRQVNGSAVAGTKAIKVLAPGENPDPSLYDQTMKEGLNYIKMRDGIELAATVRLPLGKTLEQGPFPTIVEYSGYQVAAPGNLIAGALDAVASGTGLGGLTDPLLPDTATAVGSLIAPLLDYASVSLQMRGSGCSGGAFDLFDYPTVYDGYDAIETIARQSWVKGGKVGMAGISFSGITQLLVAGTQPPHLAAISPLSVTDDIYSGTGYPGGIFNNGFALTWLKDRQDNAKPAPEDGTQPYAGALIAQGDEHCKNNQKLRLQTLNINDIIEKNPFKNAALTDHRSTVYWADKIKVPVFLVGAWQDEQTGGHWPQLVSKLDKNSDVWVTMQNGTHVDSLGPNTISRWIEFLDIFVADQVPTQRSIIDTVGGTLYTAVANGSGSKPIPAIRFTDAADVDAAKAEFVKDKRIRVIFDNGGGPAGPGALDGAWETSFDSYPVKEATATTYYLGADGALTTTEPTETSAVSYTGDPKARPSMTLEGDGEADAWAPLPPYDWEPVVDGKSLGFSTAALEEDVMMVGASSLDLTLKSTAKVSDIQVTISDVRPDGKEMLVQSGWLRTSHMTLDADDSTSTDPVHTDLKKDAKELSATKDTAVRVKIFPVGYTFRKGNKIRITIQAPGGDRSRWKFETIEDGTIKNTIALGGASASKLVLPVIKGAVAGAPLPACPSNRGEPCRDFAPASNGG